MRASAVLRALVLPVLLAAPAACSSSHAALPTCSLEAGVTTCSPGLACVNLANPGPDGLCHGIGGVCTIPCFGDSDCAPMGRNAVCSTACTTVMIVDAGPSMGVCTPYQ